MFIQFTLVIRSEFGILIYFSKIQAEVSGTFCQNLTKI
jgi:hypothetical protein